MSKHTFIESGLRTVAIESQAASELQYRINEAFTVACETLLACEGRVIVTGMGKSGHIGNKVAATLASTGTPAFFVHPGEASHGDLGMITKNDVVLALSNSGNTAELVTLIPLIKRLGIPLVSMTGDAGSVLAQAACANLDISVSSESCPLNLAPTTSTTVTLVMGDALAIALLESRGFTAEDFAFSHPGGALGRKLLLKVSDIMHQDQEVPKVTPESPIQNALLEMTEKGFGMTTIVDEKGMLLGVFTDGDLRRVIDSKINLSRALIKDVMSPNPNTINQDILAAEALNIMQQNSITAVILEDEKKHPVGVVHMHDILRAGVI
ncbi:MAG: KpsF/GutQ family sugar-phosphate isomerase [Cellvibrionales bacterium TMED47]|nr:D-arabinose 5-phosphate isomerase [Porticoccaceae bacterium]RPG84497.1 MAG: KpsF/GutQ family sugar-phosphate isomerase [Cellvibrionales bacterium TMED47]